MVDRRGPEKRTMKKIKRSALILAIALLPTSLMAAETDTWSNWRTLLQRSCRGNHIDWAGASWMELIDAFEDTLEMADQRKLAHVWDFGGCRQETAGFWCEMGASLEGL